MKGLTTEAPFPIPRIIVYGRVKIGKSTFAAQFPNPIFLDFEDGLGYLAHAYKEKTNKMLGKTNKIKTLASLKDWLDRLLKEDHDFKTVIIDSIDWLNAICEEEIRKKQNLTEFGKPFGAGYNELEVVIRGILNCLDRLRKDRQMLPILIAHGEVTTVHQPGKDPFDAYLIKLRKRVNGTIREWADIIALAAPEFYITDKGKTSDSRPMLFIDNTDETNDSGSRITSLSKPIKIELKYSEFKKLIGGE